MKKYFIVFVLAILSSVVFAHEYWLDPEKFFLKLGENITLRIWVGEYFKGEHQQLDQKKIIKLIQTSLEGDKDLRPLLGEVPVDSLVLKPQTEGTHMIVLQTNNKYIEIEPELFESYLKEDGLDNVILHRMKNGLTKTKGREFYARCVKTIFQVGDKTNNSCLKRFDLPFELSASLNPYDLKSGEDLEIIAELYGKPIENILVRYWVKKDTLESVEYKRTNKEGKISFTLKKGLAMISAVAMVPHLKKEEADWQSYWGNITFEVK